MTAIDELAISRRQAAQLKEYLSRSDLDDDDRRMNQRHLDHHLRVIGACIVAGLKSANWIQVKQLLGIK